MPDDLRGVVRADVAALASRDILDLYDSLLDPFDEHAQADHVTGSAIVIGPRGVCLHLHKRADRWLQPGGHVDPGEDPAAAALRETIEETGLPVRHPAAGPTLLTVDIHPAPKESCDRHIDLRYLLVVDGDPDPDPPPGESQQVRWFTRDEAVGAVGREHAIVAAIDAGFATVADAAGSGSP